MNKQESGNQAAAPSEVSHKGDPGKKGGFNPADGYKDTEFAENYDNERFSDLPGRVFDKAEKQRFGERNIAVAGHAPDLAYVDNHFDAVVWRES